MLENILAQLDWTQIVLFTAPTVFGALLVWYRKRIIEWRRFWRSVLDGLRTVPELRADVKGIRYYVSPNGGGSLMDTVSRTESAIAALSEQLDMVVLTMWAENDTDDGVGRFHTNASGENTYVNQLYARWLGVGKSELMGWNYLNFIHPDDVERVRRHWDLCRSEHRACYTRFRMVATDGETIEFDLAATPIPEDTPTKRWVGSIRKVQPNAYQDVA